MPKRAKPVIISAPKRIEQNYFKQMNQWILAVEKRIRQLLTPQLKSIVETSRNAMRGDSVERLDDRSDINRTFRLLDELTEDAFGTTWAETISFESAEATNAFNDDKAQKSFRRVLNVNPLVTEPWLQPRVEAFVSDNVDLIQSLQREHLRKLKGDVTRIVEQGITNKEFAKNIEREFGSTLQKRTKNAKARARLIARDQISKFNGKLTETRQTQIGFKKYRWITAGDERVRETHASKNGKVFSWNNPPEDTGHPGQDYQCRCYAEPLMTPDVNFDLPLRQQFNRR